MRRREFIALAAAASAFPLAARAQGERMRRISVIMVRREDDSIGQGQLKALREGLEALGWSEGLKVSIDVRWAGGSNERLREFAAEFVTLKPDIIVASGSPAVIALKHETATIPVVFVGINEPVAQGLIASMARPGGNITGFTQVDFSVVGKSVELLKALSPTLSRIALMYNPETYGFYDQYLERFRAEARWPFELTRAVVREPADIAAAVAALAARPDGGLVVMSDAFNAVNQTLIHAALKQYPLPHIVPWRQFVTEGGLMSYGPDLDDISRRSATYVDRILKGEKPADLPVQAPTKYELVLNLKVAKTLGLDPAPTLLALADEVIE